MNTDEPRGRLIRPFTITRGRTQPRADIAIETVMVTTTQGLAEAAFAGQDKQTIATLCHTTPMSLAEIAAHIRVPLGVARVVVADMTHEGMLTPHRHDKHETYEERMELLEKVLSGLRKL